MYAINQVLERPYDDIVKMASSFLIAMGKAQCLCVAISVGQMSLRIVQWVGENFAFPERKAHYIKITGEVAEWDAHVLIVYGKLPISQTTDFSLPPTFRKI